MVLTVIFILLIFFYSLISKLLGRSVITGPILFTAAGIAVPVFLPVSIEIEEHFKILLFIAEMGLVLLLFTDASRVKLKDLLSIQQLPTRLLTVGMLLTILLGAVLALMVFPHLSVCRGQPDKW